MKKLLLLLAFVLPTGAYAQTQANPLEVAIHARINGNPQIALAILNELEKANPRNARVKFEKGIALAATGQCAAAARTFNAGKELTPVPSYRRATQDAMDDLCPRIARIETSFSANFVYETNQNSGSESDTVEINGLPFSLSDEAVARAGSKFTFAGSISYNMPVSYRGYIVPSASVTAAAHEYSEFNEISPRVSLAYRYRGDRNDIRFGPFYGLTYTEDGLRSRDVGLAVSGQYTLNPVTALNYAASVTQKHHVGHDIDPDVTTSASLSYVRAIREGKNILTISASYSDTKAENYMNEMSYGTLSASLTGSFNPSFGYEVYAAHTIASGDHVDPLFGVRRKDNITEVGGRISLPIAETFLGRPYIGLAYVNSESSFATKNFDNTRVTFGITRRF